MHRTARLIRRERLSRIHSGEMSIIMKRRLCAKLGLETCPPMTGSGIYHLQPNSKYAIPIPPVMDKTSNKNHQNTRRWFSEQHWWWSWLSLLCGLTCVDIPDKHLNKSCLMHAKRCQPIHQCLYLLNNLIQNWQESIKKGNYFQHITCSWLVKAIWDLTSTRMHSFHVLMMFLPTILCVDPLLKAHKGLPALKQLLF